MNVYAQRLGNAVRALRESPNPDNFRMQHYGNIEERGILFWKRSCDTPQCVLGHYAARRDLQKTFTLEKGDEYYGLALYCGDKKVEFIDPEVCNHFGIRVDESREIFGKQGCNDAQSPEEAIAYIESFIARKWPQDTPVTVKPTLKLVSSR